MKAWWLLVAFSFCTYQCTGDSESDESDSQTNSCEPECVDYGGNYGPCGPDGCGGVCGECTDTDECVFRDGPYYGECWPRCEQLCEMNGYECGPLWSGSDCLCGQCAEGLVCAGTGYGNPDEISFDWDTRQICLPLEGLCVGAVGFGLDPKYFACTETETCVEEGCESDWCEPDAGCGPFGCCGYDCLTCNEPQEACHGGECI